MMKGKTNKKQLYLLAIGLGLGFLLTGLFPEVVRAVTTSELSSELNKALGGTSDTKTTINTFVMLTLLSFLPIVLVMTTSFTRIIMVLSFTRSALGRKLIRPIKFY